MDGRLINAVANNPELYDTSCFLYRDRNIKDRAWRKKCEEIWQPDQKNIPAESGQNVTLTCRAPNNIRTVEWSRADLGEKYVFLYRDGRKTTVNQHLSFKDRVDLQDKQMKDGDVSVILKDVTINDSGTYKCRVVETGTLGLKPISIISLSVVDPPEKNRKRLRNLKREDYAICMRTKTCSRVVKRGSTPLPLTEL
ncbi:uncharacterized protein LOC109199133 isoform X2 [Oreochromis niloticus]|uniref:uncharacterized protein LOC109199133 isoform X2 n=1 Tax=Oreochromis niloticus TaxID=8128 RepID=UPI000DF221AA|nr:uncharacterized protein LOC109199133 isoform X2 [Oreochromis niloticus]